LAGSLGHDKVLGPICWIEASKLGFRTFSSRGSSFM